MAGKSGTHKRSENSSVETQMNILINTPSIPFDKPKKSKDKFDDEGNYKKIEVPIEPGKKNSKTIEKKVRLFGDSDTLPEAWKKSCIELDEIIRDYPLESGGNKTTMKGNTKKKDKTGMSKTQSKDTKCTHCGRTNHASKDCWFSPENKGKSKPGKKSLDKTVMMTTEQLNSILESLTPRNSKSGTRKVRFSPVQEDTENVTMYEPEGKCSKVDINEFSDEDSIYLGLHTNRFKCFHYDENSPKQQKLSHKTTEVVGKVHGTDENGILRILLDTGASVTIILMDSIQGFNGPVPKEQTTTWNTVGGQFVTTLKREI